MQKAYPAVRFQLLSSTCPSFVCQSDKLVDLRICSGVISAEDVVKTCVGQRIHQCGGVADFARILDCALGVIARSRGITKYPQTPRTRRQESHPDIPARTRRKRTVFGRIVNRERPVVVLFAIHKVARERQSVRESDFKLDLFATQIRRGRQGRDLVKRPFELLCAFKKRGSRQRALSRCAPPFDSGFGQPCLREVMREQLRLGCSSGGKLIAQNLTRAAVQSLATALKQVLISRILNERMLKAVFGFRRKALHQEYVGLSQPFQRRSAVLRPPFWQRRGRAGRRSRVRLRQRSVPPHAPVRAGPTARSMIAAASAGLPECRLAHRAPDRSRVTSSTNSGTPPVRSVTPSITSFASA